LLTPLLQIFGIVLVWRNRGRGTWIVFLTVILNLAVVFFIFKLSLTDLTLPTMLIFHPDLGYGLIAIATLGIGWSVIFTLTTLRARKSRSSTM
jgi:hypothetical protein